VILGSKSMPEYVPGWVTFQAISAFEIQNAILGRGLQRVILGCLVHKSLYFCQKQVFQPDHYTNPCTTFPYEKVTIF
jgi:hypothetical protein